MINFRRQVGRICAGVAVLLVATLTAGQSAQAASHLVKDAKRDVYVIKGEYGEHLVNTTGAKGDITAVRTLHRKKAVDVVIRARQLSGYSVAAIEIATSAKRRPTFYVVALKRKRFQDISLMKGLDQQVSCKGLRVRRDAKQGVIRVHIPRRCLGNPRWIRTGVGLITLGAKGSARERIDVAGKKVLTDRWWRGAAGFPLSPRITAGR